MPGMSEPGNPWQSVGQAARWYWHWYEALDFRSRHGFQIPARLSRESLCTESPLVLVLVLVLVLALALVLILVLVLVLALVLALVRGIGFQIPARFSDPGTVVTREPLY